MQSSVSILGLGSYDISEISRGEQRAYATRVWDETAVQTESVQEVPRLHASAHTERSLSVVARFLYTT